DDDPADQCPVRPQRRRSRRLARRPVPLAAVHRQPGRAHHHVERRGGDHQPVDLPEGPVRRGGLRRPGAGPRPARHRHRRGRPCAHDLRRALGVRRPARGLRPDRRRRRPGVDRGRPPHRPRHRAHRGRGQGAVVAGGPAQPLHQDPRHEGRSAGHHSGAGGGDQRQRHADLLPRALRRRHGRVPGRARAGEGQRPRPVPHGLGRVLLRQPRRLRDRQAAARRLAAARSGRHRQRAPGLLPLREGGLRRPLEGPRGRGSQAAAPAVGVDRRQGPGVRRHPVRRRAGGAGDGQHHARVDARGGRRPRRRARGHGHRRLRRRPAGPRRAGPGRHLVRRRRRDARARGGRQVRGVVELPDRVGHRAAREGGRRHHPGRCCQAGRRRSGSGLAGEHRLM
ncbi:MAG: Transaldolase, partial [uncultured Frankineae bacterium]